MLLASHNMGEVERMCDDVIMLRAGLVVDQGSPQELLARYGRENMDDVFLDVARGATARPRSPSAACEGTREGNGRMSAAARPMPRGIGAAHPARWSSGMPTCCSNRGRGSCRWRTTRR